MEADALSSREPRAKHPSRHIATFLGRDSVNLLPPVIGLVANHGYKAVLTPVLSGYADKAPRLQHFRSRPRVGAFCRVAQAGREARISAAG